MRILDFIVSGQKIVRDPKCDFSAWYMPTGEKCAHCNEGYMVRKRAEEAPVCSNKSCPSNKK